MNKDKGIAGLVKKFFRRIFRRKRPVSDFIRRVRELDIPPIDPNRDLIKEYYEDWAERHGFKDIPGREHNS